MKKLMVLAVLATGSASALAVDRVVRFDLNADGKVSSEELAQSCDFRKSLFEIADKNDDGFLSNKELRNSKSYLLSNCKK
jgi:Ca2+-binding EF-hand superfamily protein